MKFRFYIITLIAGLFYVSCEMNVLNDRLTRQPPFDDVIIIEELRDIQAVRLIWRRDSGAEKYIVMKTEAGSRGIDFEDEFVTQRIELVGVQTYIDNDIDPEISYAYRLDKVSRGIVFKGVEVTLLRHSRPDPFPGVITAQNLNNGRSAYLTWQPDAGSDAYRIMRASDDGSALVFLELREGVDGFYMQGPTSAIDSILEDDKGYFYRLDKRRNGVWIPGLEITIFSRTRPMPVADTPLVNSFRADGNIFISWQYDEGADSYILMRAFDNPLTSKLDDFISIYAGNELQLLDTAVNAQHFERYVYKLYKERNGIIYEWNDRIALGVAVRAQEDSHEPNNTQEDATLLESFRMGNLYCFGFSIPNMVLEDIDWFKVSVPPAKVANIAVQYSSSTYSEYFLLYIPHLGRERSIIHEVSFQVRNDTSVQSYVFFALIPDRTKFLQADGTGGTVVGYTIHWHSIDNI